VTGEGAGGIDAQDGAATANGKAPVAAAPAETRPLNAIALAREVVLERTQNLLEWLLRRLKRYRATRGDWWEQ
jgi:hypothetical protein